MKVTLVKSKWAEPGLLKLALSLQQNGHDPKILYWNRGGMPSHAIPDGIRLHSLSLSTPVDRPAALLFLPIWWIYEFFYLLCDEADVFHASDLDTLLPAIAASLLRNKPLCYTIYDFYADNLPDGYLQSARKAIRKLVASVERLGIGFSAILFLVDESRLQEVKGARLRKVVYVYNSPEDVGGGLSQRHQDQPGRLEIFYAGSLIRGQRGLEDIIAAVTGVEGVTLALAGLGPDERFLKEQASLAWNVKFLGWMRYDDVLRAELNSDVLFRLCNPSVPGTKYASPNKLFEAMMCSKPIIVSDGSSMAEIVRACNSGLVVPYGDVAQLRQAIVQLRDDPVLRRRLGDNGRRAYDTRYSWRIMKSRIDQAYRSLDDARDPAVSGAR